MYDDDQLKLRQSEILQPHSPARCLKSESGQEWDDCLDKFKQGTININFYNNILNYIAGDCVSGTIDIDLHKNVECTQLTLQFIGVERAHLNMDEVIQPMEFHRDSKEIVRLVNVVVELPDGIAIGQYSYPFMLYLPEWLPDSIDLKLGSERFFVEYSVRAQFTPTLSNEMVTDLRLPKRFDNVSLYRGSRTIFIQSKPQSPPEIIYSQKIQISIGGVLGFGAQQSTTDVWITQNTCVAGESIKIVLKCDNSKVKYDIKNFKFKLFRQIITKNAQAGANQTTETCILGLKETGVEAKKSSKREFQVNIPTEYIDPLSKKTVPMIATWLGQVFAVNYVFRIFVKHERWDQFGQGKFVQLSLRILPKPLEQCSADEPYRVPVLWNPIQGTQEPTYLYHEADKVSEYYKIVILNNWKKWYLKIGVSCPSVLQQPVESVPLQKLPDPIFKSTAQLKKQLSEPFEYQQEQQTQLYNDQDYQEINSLPIVQEYVDPKVKIPDIVPQQQFSNERLSEHKYDRYSVPQYQDVNHQQQDQVQYYDYDAHNQQEQVQEQIDYYQDPDAQYNYDLQQYQVDCQQDQPNYIHNNYNQQNEYDYTDQQYQQYDNYNYQYEQQQKK